MNIKEALAEIEGTFGPADKSSPPTTKTMVTSGGVQNDPRDTPIALYISREAAIAAWAREVENFLDSKPFRSYQFVGEIDVDRWNITVQDKHSQHRCAEPRFVVVATIGVEWVTEGTVSSERVAPAIGDDHAKQSIPTPSDTSAHVAPTEGGPQPAL